MLEDVHVQLKVFVDLDGVLANFKAGANKAFKTILGLDWVYDEQQYKQDQSYRDLMWDTLHRYQTEHGAEIWFELDPMIDAYVLWDHVSRHPGTEILTATGKPKYNAANQKTRWVDKFIAPNVPMNFSERGVDKYTFAQPHHVLIDDTHRNIVAWQKAGGIGILHKSAADTIETLKMLGVK